MEQYIRKNNYETTCFEDEWIVLNTDTYTITRLNQTGGYCWSLLNVNQSVQSLTKEVAKMSGENETDIEEDVVDFLQSLVECGLVEYASV